MDSAQFDDFDQLQVKSKKDFDDCTGFVESDEGENGPVTVSFDKVLHDVVGYPYMAFKAP